ncbi:MAG: type II secretion system protein [Phycisphaerales bacterium]|nr:MAG: type II secretion system protein [Phycisphaerales bacterium]
MRDRKGFTLIELLVVIAVTALLMGILMPALSRVRRQARKIVCMTSVRGFTLAMAAYTAENDDKIIALYFQDEGRFWTETLQEQYKSEELRICPMATKARGPETEQDHGNLGRVNTGGVFHCWYHIRLTDADPHMYKGSYGTNGWIHKGEGQTWGFAYENHWGEMSVKGASNIPLMMDCTWVAGYPLDTERPLSRSEYADWVRIGGIRGQMNRYCFNRHDGVTNCSFLDGSCRELKLEDLWTLKWHRSFNPVFGVEIEWLNR